MTQVEVGSSAETGGLVPGDIIVTVDGIPVAGSAALRNLFGLARIDDEVEITVLREQRTVNAMDRSTASRTERRVVLKVLDILEFRMQIAPILVTVKAS